jgi:hypothetical protein
MESAAIQKLNILFKPNWSYSDIALFAGYDDTKAISLEKQAMKGNGSIKDCPHRVRIDPVLVVLGSSLDLELSKYATAFPGLLRMDGEPAQRFFLLQKPNWSYQDIAAFSGYGQAKACEIMARAISSFDGKVPFSAHRSKIDSVLKVLGSSLNEELRKYSFVFVQPASLLTTKGDNYGRN